MFLHACRYVDILWTLSFVRDDLIASWDPWRHRRYRLWMYARIITRWWLRSMDLQLVSSFLVVSRILGCLIVHLLSVSYLLKVSLLHDVLVVQDSMRELLLKDLFVEELTYASCHDRLLQNLRDRQSLAHIYYQKL